MTHTPTSCAASFPHRWKGPSSCARRGRSRPRDDDRGRGRPRGTARQQSDRLPPRRGGGRDGRAGRGAHADGCHPAIPGGPGGFTIDPAELAAAGHDPRRAAPPYCFARALGSPLFDDGAVVVFGNQARANAIQQSWARLRFKPGTLDSAVVFQTGEFAYVRLYLWVPNDLIDEGVVVAASDVGDRLLGQHVITAADRIPTVSLPASWNDAGGPWHDDVALLGQLFSALGGGRYDVVFVEVQGVPGADRVQIGAAAGHPGGSPGGHVAPVLRRGRGSLAEVGEQAVRPRHHRAGEKTGGARGGAWGSTVPTRSSAREGTAIPGASHLERVARAASPGGPPTDQKTVTGVQQSFWFPDRYEPPARLDPWVLVALPGEAEQHCFASDPIRERVRDPRPGGPLLRRIRPEAPGAAEAVVVPPGPLLGHSTAPLPLESGQPGAGESLGAFALGRRQFRI